MNSAATLFVASVGIFGALGVMFFVEEYAHRIAGRLPPGLRAEHLTLTGYEHPELVEVVFKKTLAYQPAGNWPEIAAARTVLDFGGGCGMHYKEANSKSVRWAVVETPAMVSRAKELETDKLRFFSDIRQAAVWLGPIDIVHSNGAIQYSPDPGKTLSQLCALGAKQMIWKRVVFSDHQPRQQVQSTRLADNGPGKLKGVSNKLIEYVQTGLPKEAFLREHSAYKLIEQGDDWFVFSSNS